MRQVAPDDGVQSLVDGRWKPSEFMPDDYAEKEDVICVKELELQPEGRGKYVYYLAQHKDGDTYFETLHRAIE